MEKRYFETTDVYMAAYLSHRGFNHLDSFKRDSLTMVYVFEYHYHIDTAAIEFIDNSEGEISFWDFQDELYIMRWLVKFQDE